MKDRSIKCVVWDLDDTLWNGVLLEDPDVTVRSDVVEALRTLDARGILSSIASRNDRAAAEAKLKELRLWEYFVYPQINWGAKSVSVAAVAKAINIGLDAVAFIDDQPFERDEVASAHPVVWCVDAADAASLPSRPELMPRFITEDSRNRRAMVQSDTQRHELEERFDGPQEEFLRHLDLKFQVRRAREEDLQRVEELTVRTNQLNATGAIYSYEELDALRTSPDHLLLVAGLDDRYGTYGKIGVALVEKSASDWTLKLLLMSCRVMSRGVGAVLLTHLILRAKAAGARLFAEFLPTDRNRALYITYRFSGFDEVKTEGDRVTLECDLSRDHAYPSHLKVIEEDQPVCRTRS